MRDGSYRCLTCHYVGSMAELACRDWRGCPNFAKAKADDTLPRPFPEIRGGPTEADR